MFSHLFLSESNQPGTCRIVPYDVWGLAYLGIVVPVDTFFDFIMRGESKDYLSISDREERADFVMNFVRAEKRRVSFCSLSLPTTPNRYQSCASSTS